MRLRALLAVPLLAAFALSAAEPPAKHPLTVDDIWAVVRVGRPVVSPDGRSVVYPRTTWEAEKNRNLTDLWLQPLAGGPGRRLTSHEAGESSPAFSPDGTRLAFVSKRDGDKEAQLYVLRLDGGEAERWTELPMGVQSPKWTADGRRIVFVSTVFGESLETTKAEVARREKDEKTRVKATVSENRLVRYWDHWLETDQWAAPLRPRRRDAQGHRPDARDEAAREARRRRPRVRRRARRLGRLRRELHRASVPDDEHRPLPRAGRAAARRGTSRPTTRPRTAAPSSHPTARRSPTGARRRRTAGPTGRASPSSTSRPGRRGS